MKEYKIEVGNSSTGQVGAVAYVKARTKVEALTCFKEAATFENQPVQMGSLVTCNVFFNPAQITIKDVETVR